MQSSVCTSSLKVHILLLPRFNFQLSPNMNKDQFLLLIFTLYCARKYKCGVFCAELNKIQLFPSAKSKYPDVYNYYKEPPEKGLKKFDFTINLNDLTGKSRVARGVSSAKNHLRLGDAHQIANYFITGGPLKGHAHFTKASECDLNNNEDSTVEMSNPKSENDTDSSITEQNPSTNVSDPIIGAPHIPTLPHLPILPHIPTLPQLPILPHIPPLPPIKPIVQPENLYKSTILYPPLNTQIPPPHVPVHQSLLGSILHPRLHPHISALHNFPGALVRAASMPVHGLLQAQSHLHDILQPHGLVENSDLLGSTNKVAQSSKTFSHPPIHPQPTGYIVRYVPHNKESEPQSPVTDGLQQEPSDSVDNSSNMKENVTVSTNDKNQDADKDQQLSLQSQNKND